MSSVKQNLSAEYKSFANVERRNFLQEKLEVPALVRALRLPTGCRILEVGCGRGIAMRPLEQMCRPARLVGVDIEPELVDQARARVERLGIQAEVRVGDVRDLYFAAQTFDIVIDFGTCYHISQPERALAEIARVLCRGGWFVQETRVSQLLSHPIRSFGRKLPWDKVPTLRPSRSALLWDCRVRV
jgi:ubiquinone/menaquinone biosynthesis C-methylase UbiE